MIIGLDYIGICTAFVCHDGRGNMLLHKRSCKCRDEHGAWDHGGGKLEFGVTLEENVLREVMEEYGCRGEIHGCLPAHDVFRVQNGKKTHWLSITYFVKVDPSEVKINEPEKIDELGWFTLGTLPEPLHQGFRKALVLYRNEFEKYLHP
ncbi:MAG: NUDIX domain-containing protein [Patescibacteria group bacterium]